MNNDTPPFYTSYQPTYRPIPADLSEGPWTKLVIATLVIVAFAFIVAGAYTGGV